MFEVGFSEVFMVALVALLVIGPDKLPKVARIAGFWLGKSQRMIANIKAEVQAELYEDSMRQLLEENANLKDLQDLMADSESALQAVADSAQKQLMQVEHSLPETLNTF